MEWPSVLVGDKAVGIDRLAFLDRDDEVDVAGPRTLGVEARRLRRVIGMDVVARIDLIAVASALDDDVAGAPHLGHSPVPPRAEHDAADLVRVALGAMCFD